MEEFKLVEYKGHVWDVSNLGNVKYKNGKALRKQFKNSSGYQSFSFHNIIIIVHRLVALAFVENPHGKKFVNHINGIKEDNRADNLEWVTKSENELHSTRVLGNKRNIEGLKKYWENPINKKKVNLYDLNMNFIKSFDSCKECANYLGISQSSINNHLKGRTIKAGNHIVKYHEINQEKKDVNCIRCYS
jgi:hypothetical protein